MKPIQRLLGPRTHVTWTPDYTPFNKRIEVSLVRESDLREVETERLALFALLEKWETASSESAGRFDALTYTTAARELREAIGR